MVSRNDLKTFVSGTSNQRTKKKTEGAAAVVFSSGPRALTTGNPPPWKYGAVACAYLRAAQAYMLISMPTGTSTILGVFQAISDLLSNGTADCRTRAAIGSPSKSRKRALRTRGMTSDGPNGRRFA